MEDLILTPDDVEAVQASIRRAKTLADQALGFKANPTTGDSWHDESFARNALEENIHRSSVRGLQELLKCATVVVPAEQNYEVGLGSGVLIQYQDTKEIERCLMVGLAIGDRGRWEMVSARSPIGKVLMGAHYGDELELAGRRFRVLDILSPSEVKTAKHYH